MWVYKTKLNKINNRILLTELVIGLTIPNSNMPFNVLKSYMNHLNNNVKCNKDEIIYLDGVIKDLYKKLN